LKIKIIFRSNVGVLAEDGFAGVIKARQPSNSFFKKVEQIELKYWFLAI